MDLKWNLSNQCHVLMAIEKSLLGDGLNVIEATCVTTHSERHANALGLNLCVEVCFQKKKVDTSGREFLADISISFL